MSLLGLSAAALENRRKFVCAGDALRIMAGEWNAVWREKMGLAEPVDLYDQLDWFIKRNLTREQMDLICQLGLYTEPFNLAWCQQKTGRPIDYFTDNQILYLAWEGLTGQEAKPEFVKSTLYPFMGANLDGISETPQGEPCPIDAKRVSRLDDAMIERYTPAGVHQATVCGYDWWALSVLSASSRWEAVYQPVDPLYQAEMVEREREFWGYVERGEEPEDRVDAVATPRPVPRLRTIDLNTADLSRLNWAEPMLPEIRRFVDTDAAAKLHAIAREKIVELMPEDVGLVTRGLFRARRDNAGKVIVVLQKEKSNG